MVVELDVNVMYGSVVMVVDFFNMITFLFWPFVWAVMGYNKVNSVKWSVLEHLIHDTKNISFRFTYAPWTDIFCIIYQGFMQPNFATTVFNIGLR